MLPNAKVRVFTLSELLRENQQEGKITTTTIPPPSSHTHTHTHTHTPRLGLNKVQFEKMFNSAEKTINAADFNNHSKPNHTWLHFIVDDEVSFILFSVKETCDLYLLFV